MRVVITGGSGTLGRALAPLLVERGDTAVAFDVSPIELPGCVFVRGDVRVADDIDRALEGADIVVHAAAWHGIHLRDHSPREFYELNVTGTFNVWQAAAAHGVQGLVFSSTMGVYGQSRVPAREDAIAIVHEDLPLVPGDIYGLTKVVGEELSRFHQRRDGIPCVSMRYGMFVPEAWFRYGIRLLYGGVHEEDVARAVLAAVDALAGGRVAYDVLNVESPLPFTADDGPALRSDPLLAIDRHFPGGANLLRERGVTELKPVTEVFDTRRLEERLGVRPRHDFGEWLAQLARRPAERAETNPPWP